MLSDGGSFYFYPACDNEGWESPEAAAEWARTQTIWPELDLSDGYAVAIVLGSEFNANSNWANEWADRGGSMDKLKDAPPVHNYAESLRLVRKPSSARKRWNLLDRQKWW